MPVCPCVAIRRKRGLEIGTHYGWTAAHLLAAGLKLDCVDPAFQDAERERDVRSALDKVPASKGYTLWDGFSPQCLEDVRRSAAQPWSFAFIDGNHDGDAPRADAAAVLPFLAADCMVMFHDLTSPFVEAGLAVYRNAGFKTCILNTMQILGVAWRVMWLSHNMCLTRMYPTRGMRIWPSICRLDSCALCPFLRQD